MADALSTRITNYWSQHDDGALLLWGFGALTLLAAFGLFLNSSRWTVAPVALFVVLSGVGWYSHQSDTAMGLTFLATILTVTILGLIITFIFLEAWPALRKTGVAMIYRTNTSGSFWPAGDGLYYLSPMIFGTLVTTVIATAVAAPLGIAGALFLSEIAPPTVREVVKPGIEMLAGIPSITYGFIGFVIVNDYFYKELNTPTFGSLFTVGLVIGIMALPTIVTVAEDALSTVPESMKSGSLAMGSTDWQTMKSVTVPAAFSGVSAAVLLGVGRAMGETMAATVMITHNVGFPDPIFDVFGRKGETLTTLIAFNANSSHGLALSSLFAAGVVLFLTVLVLSVGSMYIETRMQEKLGGKR
ncbi:phosphate ABC transporter permease subunit PstC [Haladaptatus sp. CMAA 1911]|uniref:phosphate ABC transporter permease subunit PstC n=1 Tax=unclassified Haladaptatus TaxID=2622732 RepID=UPI003754C353